MAYNSLDPNNAWTEDSFWDPPEFSMCEEDTPMADSMTDSMRKDFDERLRRYHQTDDDDSFAPQPKKEEVNHEDSSSSGSTLCPNTPEAELSCGDSVGFKEESLLVVLDTPDRPGYVEPELSPRSKRRMQSRRLRESGSRKTLSFGEDHDDILDKWVDLYKFHPHLAIRSRGESSQSKK